MGAAEGRGWARSPGRARECPACWECSAGQGGAVPRSAAGALMSCHAMSCHGQAWPSVNAGACWPHPFTSPRHAPYLAPDVLSTGCPPQVRPRCGGLVRVNVYKDAVKNAGSLPPLPQRVELAQVSPASLLLEGCVRNESATGLGVCAWGRGWVARPRCPCETSRHRRVKSEETCAALGLGCAHAVRRGPQGAVVIPAQREGGTELLRFMASMLCRRRWRPSTRLCARRAWGGRRRCVPCTCCPTRSRCVRRWDLGR